VHAVIDGRVLPGLPALLAQAPLDGWDCLQRGALGPAAAAQAPYIAELRAQAPFTDQLLAEATRNHPGWGLVMVSAQPLLPMRELCRSLDDAITPDGQRRPWRWYDPELLAALLPTFSMAQLDQVFAAGQSIVLPSAAAWAWHELENGMLSSTVRELMVSKA
jgi:Domain of unknown function (DUF4123)